MGRLIMRVAIPFADVTLQPIATGGKVEIGYRKAQVGAQPR
jgi:hypothetical protein